ncbi:hypothetical protein BD410DRAFT_792745 [Rickenella mellea]|uniref:Cyclase n=1 Tax=Rickenella mellea TaxID=50990 RepID=A0A4Y7PU47_9AGAM|nr:hypothetical protein BD410DRAFT_792745 [Rickenella mellea]
MAFARLGMFASHMQSKSSDDTLTMQPLILPEFDALPNFHEFTGCAWGVWGPDDQLGTVNLLTEEVVKQAATEEIRIGKSVSLNWPINFPEKPLFGRKPPHILLKSRSPTAVTRDDEIHINTQSGSQWDGLRHFGIPKYGVFYNNTPALDIPMGQFPMPDPTKVDMKQIKLGIHNWAQHGISGRAVLLDLIKFYTQSGGALPYDPWTRHAICVEDLEACAKQQGVQFRRGDILLLRIGFIQKYYSSTQEEKDALLARPMAFTGIEQSEDMKRFLWNNHFGAVASDQPTLECWPAVGTPELHQTILGLWGMPLGEMFDLEGLADTSANTGRYTFFFTSWPLNILGGCASPPNASAFF